MPSVGDEDPVFGLGVLAGDRAALKVTVTASRVDDVVALPCSTAADRQAQRAWDLQRNAGIRGNPLQPIVVEIGDPIAPRRP